MLHYAPCTKAHWEVEVQLHAFLNLINLSTRWGKVISFTSWLVHTCQNSMQYLLNKKLGGPHRKSGCNELNPNFIVVLPLPSCYIKWGASTTSFHIFSTTSFRVSLQNDTDLMYNTLYPANVLHRVHTYGKSPRYSFNIYLGNRDIYWIVKTDA
jgi:hypothetical protein